ncbi:hypothetical protein BWI17_15730 [Betaproteobacteria bacterium GR16-43]|nr:hypothetical protein BWI17_15730 [Betaproteobacteria bacterium GR16-43]
MHAADEGWRLAGAFVLHWGTAHAIVNALALIALAGLVAWKESWGAVARVASLAFAAQALVLLAWNPEAYRGASGFVYALAAYAAVRAGAIGLACAGAGYLTAQALGMSSTLLPEGISPAWPVHAAGAASGALAAVLQDLPSKIRIFFLCEPSR